MWRVSINRAGRLRFWTCVVLGLLVFRAYVPAGFMPASGQPFVLEVCPDGLDAPMPAMQMPAMAHVYHPGMDMPMASHHGSHEHFTHCPFGSLPATGPITATIGVEPATVFATTAFSAALQPSFYAKRHRAHLPRGPPPFA